jgi:lysophospholipase L1-like esterase
MHRRIVAPLLLACFLLLPSVSPVLAASDDKPQNPDIYNLPTILGLQQQQVPITRYLALGDSLAYGFQPNDDHTHGYVDDLVTALQSQGVTNHLNLGCPRETTNTFIAGGLCPYPSKSQLATALAYLQQPPAGQATLVTLDIGANDVLDHMNVNLQNKTCTDDENTFNTDLQTLDQNLTQNILPQLHAALVDNKGQSTGNLALLNYYDPFQNICPETLSLMQTLNTHLAQDVAGLGTLVDVFGTFGGATTPNPNICNYTWTCSAPPVGPDIHPTTTGYQAMANAIESQHLFQVTPSTIIDQNLFKIFNGLLDCGKAKKGKNCNDG